VPPRQYAKELKDAVVTLMFTVTRYNISNKHYQLVADIEHIAVLDHVPQPESAPSSSGALLKKSPGIAALLVSPRKK